MNPTAEDRAFLMGYLGRSLFSEIRGEWPSSIVAADLDHDLLRSRQSEFPQLRWVTAGAQPLAFRSGAFDGLFAGELIEHLPDPRPGLAEFRRVLKKGGNFIFQECYCDGDQTEAQKVDELEHAWEARIDRLIGITHNRTLTRQHIRDIAHDLKLSEIEIFDSTHLVNCLFCERKHQCEDPRNQATFHESTKDVDNATKRIREPSRSGNPNAPYTGGRRSRKQ